MKNYKTKLKVTPICSSCGHVFKNGIIIHKHILETNGIKYPKYSIEPSICPNCKKEIEYIEYSASDVEEVIHGKWINAYPEIEPNPMCMYGICSNCGFEQSISDKLKYCPECGAKMDLK